MKHFNIRIYGKVQGIGFRYAAKKQADELGVKGFVTNQPNGTVYLEMEGEAQQLEKFYNWCKGGYLYAKIEKLESVEAETKNYQSFEIK